MKGWNRDNRGLALRLAFGAGALLLLVAIGALGYRTWQQIHHLEQVNRAEAELEAQLHYERERNRRLQGEWERVSSPDFPEEWARVYGGMVLPGEVRLVVPDTPPPSPTPLPPTPVPFWQRWWESLTRESP